MEIQRVTKSSLSKAGLKEKIDKESISFTSVMDNRRNEMTLDKLNKKMKEIEDQGTKLSESQTIDNLRKYKKLVKQFLDDAVQNGLQLQEDRGFNNRGSYKIHKLVKEIDKKLIDLTNEVLAKEKNGLHTLNLIGEIKGLLINIYS